MATMRRFEVMSDKLNLIGAVCNMSYVMILIKWIIKITNGCRTRNATSSAWNCLCVRSPRSRVRIGRCSYFCGVTLERTAMEVPKDDTGRLKHVIEENIEGRIQVTGRWGRRRKQLLDDLKAMRGYWKFKEEALDQCFSTTGPRPGTGPWHQLYRAAIGSPGSCHFSFLSIFHE
jgi:hypothetical protein